MSFDSERLSHAYVTDDSFANTLAMAVVCNARDAARPCNRCSHCDKASRQIHPDIIVIDKDKIMEIDKDTGEKKAKLIISVDIIRWIKKDAYVVPNDSNQKAYIVKDADTMNASAQNAFLKMLEEPPSHAVFILSLDNPAALLRTVRSRCVEIMTKRDTEYDANALAMADDSDDDSELNELVDEFISTLSDDNVKLIKYMFRLEKIDRPTFSAFLVLARKRVILSLRECFGEDSYVAQKKLVLAESVLLKAGDMLNLNVNGGHVAGFICASLIEMGKDFD